MPLAVLVVNRHAPVEQLREFGGAQRDRQVDREQGLDLIEQEAPVAIGAGNECVARVRRDVERPPLDRLGATQQFAQRGGIEAVQDEHLRAAQQRRVQFEAGVLGGRADEGDRAVLDIRQETVLLRAIEAMDFVDEQQRALAKRRGVACGRKHAFEIGNA